MKLSRKALGGTTSSDNAGMSSAMVVRINHAVYPRFPSLHCLAKGESAPKVRPQKA